MSWQPDYDLDAEGQHGLDERDCEKCGLHFSDCVCDTPLDKAGDGISEKEKMEANEWRWAQQNEDQAAWEQELEREYQQRRLQEETDDYTEQYGIGNPNEYGD